MPFEPRERYYWALNSLCENVRDCTASSDRGYTDTATQSSTDVARQVFGSNVRHRVVVWRNAKIVVIALVSLS